MKAIQNPAIVKTSEKSNNTQKKTVQTGYCMGRMVKQGCHTEKNIGEKQDTGLYKEQIKSMIDKG